MSARYTLTIAKAEIADLKVATQSNSEKLDAILAHLTSGQPAVVAASPQVSAPKARKTRALSRKSLEAFKAASEYDFTGWSTKDVAAFCVTEGYAPKGFHIGEGYTALYS